MTSGGDWAEQARRLMEALRAAVPPTTPGGAAESPSTASRSAAADGSSGDCRWCPLCQAAAMVRGERPELTAALADILTATATALRQFAGEPAPAPEPPATEETAERAAPAVQRIELS